MPIMRSTQTLTAMLPCSGLWTTDVRAMMDPDHRLILRWCRHLEFEDVLRIDCGSIHAALMTRRDPWLIGGSPSATERFP
jgi:hypothetical protein